MNNPTQHECSSCGHTWLTGQHGGHDCKDRLLAKIAKLEAAAVSLAGNHHKAMLYDALMEEAAQIDARNPSVAWQFFFLGEWHNGIQNLADHRKNTEAAGIPTRDLYAGSVISAGGLDERAAFEAELVRLGYPYHVRFDTETGYACGFGAEYWRIWKARAQLAAPSTAPTSDVYGADPLACSGCVSGCFRCSAPASDVVPVPRELHAFELELKRITHDERTPNEISQELAALLIVLRALLNGGRS